jgi:MprA protease rhombosortase-interaction domain-containing protein
MRTTILTALLVLLATVILQSSVPADMFRDHAATFDVWENITDLGGGQWQYDYNFTSNEKESIWHFLVYTDWSIVPGSIVPPDSSLIRGTARVSASTAPYDARNIAPSAKWLTTFYVRGYQSIFGDSPDAVQSGDTVASFSFRANTYDANSKLFAYDAGQNWATQSGDVSAYGWTGARQSQDPNPPATPELSTWALLACSGLAGFALRRRRQS